jgi:hypothetical protein
MVAARGARPCGPASCVSAPRPRFRVFCRTAAIRMTEQDVIDQTIMPALHGGELRQDSLGASGLAHWPAAMPARPGLFRTFLMGGFESSSHRRAGDERQLDLLAATRHDEHACGDYSLLAACGIRTVRDALRCTASSPIPGAMIGQVSCRCSAQPERPGCRSFGIYATTVCLKISISGQQSS